MAKKNNSSNYKKNKWNNNKQKNGQTYTNSNSNNSKPLKAWVEGGVFVYSGAISLDQLAKSLNIPASAIMKDLFMKGKMLTINSILDDELIGEICLSYDIDFKKEEIVEKQNFEKYGLEFDPKDGVERAPVVTIMGHVDHGKTTLIDAIRGSNIVSKEAGNITQSIGAYQKEINGKKITFLDTPGHEAFTAMRARGASLTDIAIIVVAADDGVMPQTREAIDHAKAAGVSIIIAINKIDKPGANSEKIKADLSGLGLVCEEWGGDTIMVEISAKQGTNLDKLLETVLFVAEMKELKANPLAPAYGSVIEATLDPHQGPKATLLVQNGTLHVGDNLVVGNAYCKVRKMVNEYGKSVQVAPPSTPVSVTGLSDVPVSGDHFIAYESEKEAKQMAQKRALTDLSKQNYQKEITLDSYFAKITSVEKPRLNLIVKADSTGSVEAIKSALTKIDVSGVDVNIIRGAAGEVSESDVILAQASSAVILAFNIKTNPLAISKAKEEKIDIRSYDIIYRLIEDVEAAMKGKLLPVYEEVIYGHATVTQLFKSSATGIIAGCIVSDGTVKSRSKVRVMRKNNVIQDTSIVSLKRFKDDVKEVGTGFDCGIVLKDNDDIKVDDVFEVYGEEVKKNG